MNDKHLRVWFVVFVIAVFVAGIGGGLIADRFLGPRHLPPGPGRGASMYGPTTNPAAVRHALGSDLGLSPEQQRQLDEIWARRRDRMTEVQREMQARFDSEQRAFRDEIEKILTPEQRKRFEEWLQARESAPWHMPGMGHGRGMGAGRGHGPM